MGDFSALPGLLDRAAEVFSLAGEVGRAFQEDHDDQRRNREIDSEAWKRHTEKLNKLLRAVADLREPILHPPAGFENVALILKETGKFVRDVRDAVQDPSRCTLGEYLEFYPDLNTVRYKGWEAVKAAKKANGLEDPLGFVDELPEERGGPSKQQDAIGEDFIERLLAGPPSVELGPKQLAYLEAHLQQRRTLQQIAQESKGSDSGLANDRQKLQQICDFNRRLQASPEPLSNATESAERVLDRRVSKADIAEGKKQSDKQADLRLVNIFTNGVADERIIKASTLLNDSTLKVNEKLTAIDNLMKFPPTASAQSLADMLGVTKAAVLKTEWWQQNRRGKRAERTAEREESSKKRGELFEAPVTEDDDWGNR